ncbi:MAG: ABC transporter permease, partial [Chloroflexota bacterium]
MEKLFGLEMATIAGVLSAVLVLVIITLALLAWRRPVFLKLGLRPIPRRRAQSVLIVLGLMLATLIITAAFITGDTLSNSISSVAIEGMGEIDEQIEASGGNLGSSYFKMARYESLAEELAGYPLVDHLLPVIRESAPVVNVTRRSSLRSISVLGARPEDIWVLPAGEVIDTTGKPFALDALGLKEVYLNAAAAEDLGAAPGDELELYIGPHPKDFVVRAISGQGEEPRMFVNLRQAQRMFNQSARINLIVVSNLGDALGGVEHSQEVT